MKITWRIASWWQCGIALAVTALVGWIVRMGLQSTGPGIWNHVIIPPFALLCYATLASLVNRISVVVTPAQLVMSNGPLPLAGENERLPRDEVSYIYHVSIETAGDSGGTIVLWHQVGVATRGGRDIPVFTMIKDADTAASKAQALAAAFGTVNAGPAIAVRRIGRERDHPADWRQSKIWGGAVATAFVAGFVWDLALRLG
jgi:hypothetical protein